MRRYLAGLVGFLLLYSHGLAADPDTAAIEPDERARQLEELRLHSVNLARDIWLLEQEADGELGRLLVFLSVDPKLNDRPTSIELKLGEDSIALHDYNRGEADALAKGGAHRLYAAGLDAGRHVLDAQLHTQGAGGNLRHNAKLSFRSSDAPKTIELRLQPAGAGEVELTVREWD